MTHTKQTLHADSTVLRLKPLEQTIVDYPWKQKTAGCLVMLTAACCILLKLQARMYAVCRDDEMQESMSDDCIL